MISQLEALTQKQDAKMTHLETVTQQSAEITFLKQTVHAGYGK